MGFYSFVVLSPREIPLGEIMVVLERGRNTFNGLIRDIDAFRAYLEEEGVEIVQMNRLDVHEPVPEEMTNGALPSVEDTLLMGGPKC